ncbi:MAG TPA: hypothetical protein VGH89_36750 [Pseudonocardia sp.]|jgi:hypothetical protein
MGNQPAWREAFDRIERAVGAPLEEAAASRRYIDLIVFWKNGPLAVNRKIFELIDDQLGRVLHMLNLPTREDVNQLSDQLSVLVAELRNLSLPADRIEGYVTELKQRESRAAATPAPKLGSVVNRRRPAPGDGDAT